ncbi:MAG: ribosome assembly RNA-binding protein YhbY [Eubacteriales bacterium]
MITSKQRAYLRSLANPIDTIFQIGKGGVNINMIMQICDALEARELIKLRVLENSEYTAREAAQEIAERTDSEVVQVIGTRFVLYKQSRENKKIVLEK